MLRFIVFLLFTGTLLLSCSQRTSQIVKEKDYMVYLNPEISNAEKKKNADELSFWQKRLLKDTGSYVNMLELAKYTLNDFRLTGNIASLHKGDSLLRRSSLKLNNTDPDILFALSQNSITQHQFSTAALCNENAGKANGDPYTIKLLQFDSWMELGRYADAFNALNSIADGSAFDYLIRKAKWEDHRGNLEEAINLMEQAFEKIKNKKKSLYCWTLSNLADMYGHAGRIKESYQAYLDVLKKDPANLYCLKGIAWIAYSYDGNNAVAKHILQYILSQTDLPNLKLMLAEIAETENDTEGKNKWLTAFLNDVQKPGYGNMYNKYLIAVYNDAGQYQKALTLAENELKNRYTPETCDWIAWCYYKSGDKLTAMKYAKGYVYRKTFEPDALLHTAFIFADNGNNEEAKALLKECLQSSFELGPVATAAVREKLASL